MVTIDTPKRWRLRTLAVWLVVLSALAAPTAAAARPAGAVDAAGSTGATDATDATGAVDAIDGGMASAVGGPTQAADIEVSTDRLRFGSARADGPDSETVAEILTVTNAGDAPVSIEETRISGPDDDSFQVLLGGGPTTLAPGESLGLTVAFAPTTSGNLSATLRIVPGEGSPTTVELVGTGVAPDIALGTETVRFENETDEPVTETLTLRNDGDAPLSVRAVRVVGPDRTAFELDATEPFTLAPNEVRNVTVTLDAERPAPRYATIHVISDDPDEPQRNVWLTNTPTVADVSPSTVLANRTIVNVTVGNAQADTPQSVNVSWPLTRDDAVAIDALSFTPERGGNFTINVTKSSQRFAGTPPFNLSDGTEDAAFVSINGSVADRQLRNVSVVFRVRKNQLAGNETGPEDVSLYTQQNGTWTELPTQLVDESQTHYFFEARSSGLTDFATGIKQAKFRIADAVVSVTEIRTGESVDVSVRVTNVGGADGTYVVKLLRNETVVERRELSIAPNGTRQTVFIQSFDRSGTYQLYVNNRFVGNVTVSGESANATTPEIGAKNSVENSPVGGEIGRAEARQQTSSAIRSITSPPTPNRSAKTSSRRQAPSQSESQVL